MSSYSLGLLTVGELQKQAANSVSLRSVVVAVGQVRSESENIYFGLYSALLPVLIKNEQ